MVCQANADLLTPNHYSREFVYCYPPNAFRAEIFQSFSRSKSFENAHDFSHFALYIGQSSENAPNQLNKTAYMCYDIEV